MRGVRGFESWWGGTEGLRPAVNRTEHFSKNNNIFCWFFLAKHFFKIGKNCFSKFGKTKMDRANRGGTERQINMTILYIFSNLRGHWTFWNLKFKYFYQFIFLFTVFCTNCKFANLEIYQNLNFGWAKLGTFPKDGNMFHYTFGDALEWTAKVKRIFTQHFGDLRNFCGEIDILVTRVNDFKFCVDSGVRISNFANLSIS